MADDCVIRVTGLKKSFPKGKEVLHVLKGIDMEIRPGEVIGYLGSNGAGKSTTVKIMCGLLEDFEGKVDVLGYDVRENDIEVKKRIGYIPENAVMYEHLTPMEYLEFIGAMYGLDRKEVSRKADELLSLFEMRENRDVRMVNFSKGMKQKVHIISGLLHNPEGVSHHRDILRDAQPRFGQGVVAAQCGKVIREDDAGGPLRQCQQRPGLLCAAIYIVVHTAADVLLRHLQPQLLAGLIEIGRASCRERV